MHPMMHVTSRKSQYCHDKEYMNLGIRHSRNEQHVCIGPHMYVYIYLYIYICVCVCVCVSYLLLQYSKQITLCISYIIYRRIVCV